MSTTSPNHERTTPQAAESKPSVPVLWWATFGAVILAFQLIVWGRWLLNASPTSAGPDEQPQWMTIVQIATQIVMPLLLVWTCWLYLIRPKLRTGRFSRDGLLWASWLLLWFWDPLLNYFQNFAVYNPNMVNLGSWTNGAFPGWSAPNSENFAEPILMMPAVYAAVLFPATIWTCKMMAKLRDRGLSAPMNIFVTWLVMTVVSFILEGLIFMPLGFYVIPGATPELSINAGTYFQFPAYHAVFFGAWCAAATALRFFTNKRDETLVERGAHRFADAPRKQTFVRFLALFAATVSLNALYFVPIQYFAIKSGEWPTSITDRSYFRGGICGEGTTYACPGPKVPVPRGDSDHVGPDGTLVTTP